MVEDGDETITAADCYRLNRDPEDGALESRYGE